MRRGARLLRGLGRRALGVHVVVVRAVPDDEVPRLPEVETGDGPEPPSPGAVQIRYAGWMVEDGEPVVRVGEVWRPRLELQRHEGGSPSNWFPDVGADRAGGDTALQPNPEAAVPATYRFRGQVLTAQDAGLSGQWSAVEADGVRFAVPGLHHGRIHGLGYLQHDTYMVDGDEVLAAITQPRLVERIQALRHVYDRRGPGPEVRLAGYAAPVDVTRTRDRLTASPGDHTFFIDVRPVA